jgi:peptidase M48-like protein
MPRRECIRFGDLLDVLSPKVSDQFGRAREWERNLYPLRFRIDRLAKSYERKAFRISPYDPGRVLSLVPLPYISTQAGQTELPRTGVVQPLSWVALPSTYVLFLFTLAGSVAAAPAGEPSALVTERLQLVVDRLRGELGIPQDVNVSIEPQVALVVSVAAPLDRGEPFRLAIEDGFLERLSDEELDAAMAHELGHVWVFTHHPYLQTEKLANQIAMRVVTRDSLVSVYHKLWEHGATKGDLESFLGPVN